MDSSSASIFLPCALIMHWYLANSRHTSHVTSHTSHVTHVTHVTRHTSHVTRHTSHVTRHTSHVTRHTLSVTHHTLALSMSWQPSTITLSSMFFFATCTCRAHHTSHVTRHTSHVTRHTSHVTRHTSHVTRHTSRAGPEDMSQDQSAAAASRAISLTSIT
jgi:hypothetical protein